MEKKKYYIEISYQTGDSFHSEDDITALGMEWNYLDVAKENLKRIKKHYEWYDKYHGYSSYTEKEREAARPSFADKKWYGSIHLVADNGNDCMMSAFWCGHFETLYYAEIKEHDDPSLVYVTKHGEWKR